MTSFAMLHKLLGVCCWMLFTVWGARFVGTMMHRVDYTRKRWGKIILRCRWAALILAPSVCLLSLALLTRESRSFF